jgi:drug/metabolite transporter (DMT)-like permease
MGEAAALGSALLWAASSSLVGSQARRLSPFVISTIQLVGSCVLLWLVCALLYAGGELDGVSLGRGAALAVGGIIGPGIGDTLYVGGVRAIGVARAFPVSMAIFPLFTFILAVLLVGESITPPVVAGAVMIVAGTILLTLRSAGDSSIESPESKAIKVKGGFCLSTLQLGLLLVAAGAFFWAVNSVWVRETAEGVAPALVGAIRMPVALLFTASVARSRGQLPWPGQYRGRSLVVLLVAGIMGTGVGSLLWVVGIQHAGVARTAILSSTAPLFALPLAALFLHERITGRMVAGTLLSIAGIWLVTV